MNMKPLRIVVVDDAPFIRDAIKTILIRAGHSIVGEAGNGNEAVKVALETKPDVVIMDIVMPEKSGIQATKEILESLPKTRILGCSTLDQEFLVTKAIEAGVVDFIQKPFDAAKVRSIFEDISKKLEGKSP